MDVSQAAKELAAEMWNVGQVHIAQEIANRHIKKAQVEVLDLVLKAERDHGARPACATAKLMREALAAGQATKP